MTQGANIDQVHTYDFFGETQQGFNRQFVSADRSMIRDEAKTLRTLNEFAIELMHIPNADDLFWYVARNVVGRLNFLDCVIYKANHEQTTLTQVAALGDKNPSGRTIANPLIIPFGQGITGKVAQNAKAIIIDDLQTDQNYIPDTQPARSEICVPMRFRNRIVGVIDSEHPDPNAFGDAELEILTTVAAMCSAKLELLEEAGRSAQRYNDLVRSHSQLADETANRKKLEEQLFEAQKLETIGRLAGGVAHDFNNLLTVISANLESLEMTLGDSIQSNELTAAQEATQRGAKLTKNMLAFARKSWLTPQKVQLNSIVKTVWGWSKQTIGESIHADLSLADDLQPIKVDVNGTENALLNLIMNARDAMPGGGNLQICTENIQLSHDDTTDMMDQIAPGAYVRLSVQDTGKGIAEKLITHIFEPFYSTKTIGDGHGLGLSMIWGFMRQSEGTIQVQTVLGKGSKFSLYFPVNV